MTDHPGEARIWADHHNEFSLGASRLFHSVLDALSVLSAIQYSAPWKRR